MAKTRKFTLVGPDKLTLSRADIASLLGVSEDTVNRMVDAGRFPRGAKPTSGTEPIWSGLDVAAWLHLASRLIPGEGKKSGD